MSVAVFYVGGVSVLYVSRRIDEFTANEVYHISTNMSCYGIVDTDDDTEDIITEALLSYMVYELGMKVEGAERGESPNWGQELFITPYQDQRYCSSVHTKTKTLLGVDVRTYKGEITAIIADGKFFKGDTRIRLSKYGNVINQGVLLRFIHNLLAQNSLILVMDDKIEIGGNIFRFLLSNVYFDLSEVSNVEQYGWCFDGIEDEPALNYIIDKHGRVGNLTKMPDI